MLNYRGRYVTHKLTDLPFTLYNVYKSLISSFCNVDDRNFMKHYILGILTVMYR